MLDRFLQRLWKDESGQDLVEYVLLLGLITLVVIAALNTISGEVNNTFSETASTLSSN